MIPDGNNVYGTIRTRQGLEQILGLVTSVRSWDRAAVRRSGYTGWEEMRLESCDADFEVYPVDGDQVEYFFNGAVGGSAEEVKELVQSLSNCLSSVNIENHFEIYDESESLLFEISSQIS